jgi:hypothetical protein
MANKKVSSINDLILFILYSSDKEGKATFEGLVKNCFENYPDVFSLKSNPQWPDTRKLDRPLRTLRKKGLISGDPATFFALTKKGKKEAEEISKILKQKPLL